MSVEPEPKVFLQNKLARSQERLEELQPIIETKREAFNELLVSGSQYTDHWIPEREAKKLYDLADSYAKNPKLGPVDSAIDVG